MLRPLVLLLRVLVERARPKQGGPPSRLDGDVEEGEAGPPSLLDIVEIQEQRQHPDAARQSLLILDVIVMVLVVLSRLVPQQLYVLGVVHARAGDGRDALDDGRVISGIGGQSDFVVQAHALPGARSIIAARATRGAGGGKATSNIVWRSANTSIPRQLRDVYVTEYGVADVRGRTDREVVEAMLAIADSRFQADLQRDATSAGKLGASFRLPASASNNTPEAISAALGLARRDGLLPVFPLGTEMTETEQALIPALGALKSASPLGIAQLLWRGASAGGKDATIDAALKRMSLDAPQSIKERAIAALISGALQGKR